MTDGLFVGLGIAIAGVALALALRAGLVAIAVAMGYAPPAKASREETHVLEHVGDIDLSRFNPSETDEVLWVEETLSRSDASQADLLEAHRLLEMYRGLAKERSQDA